MIWRLIRSGPAPGDWNMAVDTALLEGTDPRPCLRLYGWWPPALSLGFAQSPAVADGAALGRLGVDLVRRPTGGGAVLHDGPRELTYAVVAEAGLFPGGILETYRRIAEALVAGLRGLGLEARLAPRPAPGPPGSPVCFVTPSAYELLVGGRKAVGSAQCRRGGRVLQHGAVALSLDRERSLAVFAFADPAARQRSREQLEQHATSLSEAAGRTIGADQAARALMAGFEAVLGAEWQEEGLTAREVERARRLRREHPPLAAAWRTASARAGG